MKNTENKDTKTKGFITLSQETFDALKKGLTCPVTQYIFAVPVNLPCCGKMIEKIALFQSVSAKPECPCCKQELLLKTIPSLSVNVVIQQQISDWMKAGKISLDELYFDFNSFIDNTYTRDTSVVKTLLPMIKNENFQNTLTEMLSDERDPQKIDEAKVYFLSMLLKEENELTKEISKQFNAVIEGNEVIRNIQEKIDKEYPIAQLMVLPGGKGIDLLKRFPFILNNAKPEESGRIILDLLCEEKQLKAAPNLLPLFLEKLKANEAALKTALNYVEKEGPFKGTSIVLGLLITSEGKKYLEKNPKLLMQLLRLLNKDTLNAVSVQGMSILKAFLSMPEDILYSKENIELLPFVLSQITDDTLNSDLPMVQAIIYFLSISLKEKTELTKGISQQFDAMIKENKAINSIYEKIDKEHPFSQLMSLPEGKGFSLLRKFPFILNIAKPEELGKIILNLLCEEKQWKANHDLLPLLLETLMTDEAALKTALNYVEKEGPFKGTSIVMGLLVTAQAYVRQNPKLLTQLLRYLDKDTLNAISEKFYGYSILNYWLFMPDEIVVSKENIELLPSLLAEITDETLNSVTSEGHSIIVGLIGRELGQAYLAQEKQEVFASLLKRLTAKTLNTVCTGSNKGRSVMSQLLMGDYGRAFFEASPLLFASLLELLTRETCTALTPENRSIVFELIWSDLGKAWIAENPASFMRMLTWAIEAKTPLNAVWQDVYSIVFGMVGSEAGKKILNTYPDLLIALLKSLTSETLNAIGTQSPDEGFSIMLLLLNMDAGSDLLKDHLGFLAELLRKLTGKTLSVRTERFGGLSVLSELLRYPGGQACLEANPGLLEELLKKVDSKFLEMELTPPQQQKNHSCGFG